MSESRAGRAACPVVVVREPASADADHVVVGTDGSSTSDAALGWAFGWAAHQGLPLTVVHAWPGDLPVDITRSPESVALEVRATAVHAQEVALETALAPWQEAHPDVVVHVVVPVLEPVDAIVSQTAGAQLVVVGSRGRGGLHGLLLGSVSQGVLHQAHCPVAIVRTAPARG